MIQITPTLGIPRSEVDMTFARSGGPGGQNVQKVSSKVLLRWNPAANTSLPADVKARLLAQQRHRLTRDGDLLITSQRTRDQGKNIDDCLEKLREIVRRALAVPKRRRPTRPSRGSKERRLQAKKKRSSRKVGRSSRGWDE
jgi:ribosome-associated protein